MIRAAAAILALAAAPALAAGPLEGIKAASDEAGLRYPGSELVEAEAFAGADGDVPCSGKSFSDTWHYKFRYKDGWAVIDACGGKVMNAARHYPTVVAEEPATPLPDTFIDSAALLKELSRTGAFTASPGGGRDVLMDVRMQPAKGGHPAGCYWTVSQSGRKAMADCEGNALGAARPPAQAVTQKKGVPRRKAGKGPKETASRYYSAARTAARTIGAAVPVMIEALASPRGAVNCAAGFNWTYVFRNTGMNSMVTAGCGSVAKASQDMDGRYASIRTLEALPEDFVDSAYAAESLPEACAHPTMVMRLRNFRPADAPVAGHSLLWTLDCGMQRYYVDGHTGDYLGNARK